MYIEQDGDYDFCDLTLTITWENEIDSYANNKPVESINLTWTIEDGSDGPINTSRRFIRTLRNLRTKTMSTGRAVEVPDMKPSKWIDEMLGVDWCHLACYPDNRDKVSRPMYQNVLNTPDALQVSISKPKLGRLDASIIRDVKVSRRFYTQTYRLQLDNEKEREL